MENNKIEETKEKLAEIKDFLVSVIGNAPIGIMTINMGEFITVCNQTLLRILKKDISNEEAINQPISIFLKKIPALLKAIDHAYLKSRQSFNMPMVSYKDRFLAIKARKISDGMLFFVDDITERKKMEQQLMEGKAKDEAILASIGDAVFVVDKNLQIIMFNRVAAKITGCQAADAIGKDYHKVLHFISEKDDKTKDLFMHDAMPSDHTMLILKDGQKIPVAESASPLRDSTGNILGFVIVFRDVSRERAIEQAKDDFLNIAAHDLRTPMSGIRANSEMILGGDYGEIPPKLKSPLQDIDQANLNLIKMVNDFLTISRIEKGKITVTPKPVDILPILNSIVKQMKPLVEKRGLRFDFEIPAKLPLILADSDKIPEVVNNLLDNAIKFTDKGSISLRVFLKEDSVVVKVKDAGIGIAKERQKNLFQKYTQIGTEKRIAHGKGTGLGLGLYISRLIIEGCGGKIWVDSVLGKGSTFYFSLPIAKN